MAAASPASLTLDACLRHCADPAQLGQEGDIVHIVCVCVVRMEKESVF